MRKYLEFHINMPNDPTALQYAGGLPGRWPDLGYDEPMTAGVTKNSLAVEPAWERRRS